MSFTYYILKYHGCSRVVTKISGCLVNTTSRRGIKQLGTSFSSTFLLFSFESSQGRHSQQPGEIPGPRLLMTALLQEEQMYAGGPGTPIYSVWARQVLVPPDRVRVLFGVSFLPILAFVLQVFSSDWVPKLYQLKFKCLNAQLHK